MRRSRAIRLTLLPVLASAAVATAQEWVPNGNGGWYVQSPPQACVTPYGNLVPCAYEQPYPYGLPLRQGFGFYFWTGG
jgi:hypothetical protein